MITGDGGNVSSAAEGADQHELLPVPEEPPCETWTENEACWGGFSVWGRGLLIEGSMTLGTVTGGSSRLTSGLEKSESSVGFGDDISFPEVVTSPGIVDSLLSFGCTPWLLEVVECLNGWL